MPVKSVRPLKVVEAREADKEAARVVVWRSWMVEEAVVVMLVPVAFVNPSCPAVTTPFAPTRKTELVANVALVVAMSMRLPIAGDGAMYSEANGTLVVPTERPWVKAKMVEVATMVLLVVEVNGHANEALLLNVLQSAAVRSPRTVWEADGRLKVKAPATFVMPQSLEMAVEEVAKVMAPVCAVPYVWAMEETFVRQVPPIA